jgi:hypothetical protein
MEAQAHHYLGIEMNQQVWALLGQESRDESDARRMEHFALASLHHWERSPSYAPMHYSVRSAQSEDDVSTMASFSMMTILETLPETRLDPSIVAGFTHEEMSAMYREGLDNPDHRYLVVTDEDDLLVGHGIYLFRRDESGAPYGYLYTRYVLPAHRRRDPAHECWIGLWVGSKSGRGSGPRRTPTRPTRGSRSSLSPGDLRSAQFSTAAGTLSCSASLSPERSIRFRDGRRG